MGTELKRWMILEAMYSQIFQQAARAGKILSREEFMRIPGGITTDAAGTAVLVLLGLPNLGWTPMVQVPNIGRAPAMRLFRVSTSD